MDQQEGLTPAESKFFESGGQNTEGLSAGAPDAGAQQPQEAPQAPEGQQAPQQPEGQQQPQEQRTVPLAALQEERAERKRLRDELGQLRDQQNALVQRILASQQQPQQQPQQPQIPDFATDPVGHLRAKNELLERQLQQVAGYIGQQDQQQQQMTQAQRAQQEVQNFLVSDEARFRQQAPDYDAAAKFLQDSRAAEYRALGMQNPMEIQQALNQDVLAMVNIAQRNGTSVAEAAYNLAKARGYKTVAPQQDAAARLANVAAGQQHAASLSQAGGGSAPPMSIERLLAMSDADFAKATSGTNWQQLNAELSR